MVAEATLKATAILDYGHPRVQEVLLRLRVSQPAPREFLRMAHGHLSDVMRPIYSVAETQAASETLRLNGGSCSQRMACLEALARAYGVATRVRALWLDKTFWAARLPLLRPIMPKRTLMPWPQFYVDGVWIDFDEIYDSMADLAVRAKHPFTNAGESLFDAVRDQPVDLLGKSDSCSLTRFVVGDDGMFDTRDELLGRLDDRTWIGKLIFNLTYGGKPVRRLPE
jgi:transglutaminase-like putative cysteine protease